MKGTRRLFLVAALAISGCAGVGAADGEAPQVHPDGEVFRDARALTADVTGRLYVVDAGASVIRILAPDGDEVATLGGGGTSDEGLFAPIDVDPTNGQAIYVADRESGTIHRFTSEFRAAEVFAVPDFAAAPSNAARARPSAVLAGPGGMLYVAEESRGVVLLLNASRELERVISPSGASSISKPVGLSFEAATGNLMVADGATGMIRIFDPFGTPLRAVQAVDVGNLIGISQAEERGTLVIGSAGIALMADYGLPIVVYAWTETEPLVDAELVGGDIWLLTSRRLRRVSLPTD